MGLLTSEVPDDVGPGYLIRAQDYNTILAWLRHLNDRLTDLEEADESVAIYGVIPAGAVRVGDYPFEIIGRNFGYSLGAHRVYFNSTRATFFSTDSGDERLVLKVPDVPGVSEVGTQVLLTVGNATSVDTKEITVRPAIQQQEGNIGLLYTGATVDHAPATEIPAGSTVRFHYNLESDTLLPVAIHLTPTVIISGVQYDDLVEVLDSTGALLTDRQIDLEPGQKTIFSLQGDIPAGSDGMTFQLSVEAQASGVSAAVDSRTFTIGQELTPTDPAVTAFIIRGVNPGTARSGNTLMIESGQKVNVELQAEFTLPLDDPGPYAYTFSVDEPTAPWVRVVPSTHLPYASNPDFDVSGPTDIETVSFDISRPTGVSASPTFLTCRLQRESGDQTLETLMMFVLEPA